MKKAFYLLLSLVLVFACISCDGDMKKGTLAEYQTENNLTTDSDTALKLTNTLISCMLASDNADLKAGKVGTYTLEQDNEDYSDSLGVQSAKFWGTVTIEEGHQNNFEGYLQIGEKYVFGIKTIASSEGYRVTVNGGAELVYSPSGQ